MKIFLHASLTPILPLILLLSIIVMATSRPVPEPSPQYKWGYGYGPYYGMPPSPWSYGPYWGDYAWDYPPPPPFRRYVPWWRSKRLSSYRHFCIATNTQSVLVPFRAFIWAWKSLRINLTGLMINVCCWDGLRPSYLPLKTVQTTTKQQQHRDSNDADCSSTIAAD